MNTVDKHVVVIGAGPMGLMTAWSLAKAGVRVTLLEEGAVPGGMSACFSWHGEMLERFYHFFNLPDLHFLQALDELGIRDKLQWTPTKMGFYMDGTLFPWSDPIALLRFPKLSLVSRLRYGFHMLHVKRQDNLRPLDEVRLAEWLVKWEGRACYDMLWRPLLEKKFFELADPLSAAWIATRIRRVARSRTSLFEERLAYLEGGCQVLIDALLGRLHKLDASVRCNENVLRVERRENKCLVTSRTSELSCDGVISTIPLPYVSNMIPQLDEVYRTQLNEVNNIGVACVLLRLKKPLTNNFWLNINMPSWDIPGIIEYSNLRPLPWSLLYIPFYMPSTHPNWRAEDAALLSKAVSYVRHIGKHLAEDDIIEGKVGRYSYAQPVCPPGFSRKIPSYETGLPGVLVADTTHSYPEDRSINESFRIGKELADKFLAGIVVS